MTTHQSRNSWGPFGATWNLMKQGDSSERRPLSRLLTDHLQPICATMCNGFDSDASKAFTHCYKTTCTLQLELANEDTTDIVWDFPQCRASNIHRHWNFNPGSLRGLLEVESASTPTQIPSPREKQPPRKDCTKMSTLCVYDIQNLIGHQHIETPASKMTLKKPSLIYMNSKMRHGFLKN